MYISRIELTNIKSHVHSVYEFGPGTTAITGENGAGKTTIIEAIAWVVFDLLDYNKDQFVRRGEKKGSVEVRFISGLDEREYIVFRDSASAYNVTDPRLKTLIADKKEEVHRFLWQHLGLEPGTDLESLFRHAIGVPQGTFTAIFLAPASNRKIVFDRLLKVEEYRDAAAKLLETVRFIDAQIGDAREEIARAEGVLSRSPNVDEEHRGHAARTADLQKEIAAINSDLALRRETVALLDDVEKADRAVSVAENDRTRVQKALADLQNAHAEIELIRPKSVNQQQIEADLRVLREDIVKKRAVRDQLRHLDENIERLRERYRKNLKDIENAKVRSKGSEAIPDLEKRDFELTGRLARLRAELERDERFQREIENGLCPILTEKCLNLKPGQTLEGFVESQFPALRSEITGIEAEQRTAVAELRIAREALTFASTIATLDQKAAELTAEGQQLKAQRDSVASGSEGLEALEERLTGLDAALKKLGDPRSRLLALEGEISRETEIRASMTEIETMVKKFTSERDLLLEKLQTSGSKVTTYDASAHAKQKTALRDAETRHAALTATLAAAEQRAEQLAAEIQRFAATRLVLADNSREKERLEKVRETTAFIRDTLKEAAPRVARNYVHHVSVEANQLFREITGHGEQSLKWNDDYSISLEEDGFERPFISLSGGEQMSAALAVRLALLKQLTDIRLAFFDEPTTNMDFVRRENLAIEISRIRHFDQLFVISHDDTFEGYMDNEITMDK